MLMGFDSAKDQALLWGAECLQDLLLTKGAEALQHLLKAYSAWEHCAPNEHPRGTRHRPGKPRGTWQGERPPSS